MVAFTSQFSLTKLGKDILLKRGEAFQKGFASEHGSVKR